MQSTSWNLYESYDRTLKRIPASSDCELVGYDQLVFQLVKIQLVTFAVS